ncbi:MAG: pyruvate, water dikinase [Parcubacteria group bacterium Gr01-1014_30]|nr:MAG: pyruvate, water dikinase [Parcubacteria group bacterium Gr01-1014_30]
MRSIQRTAKTMSKKQKYILPFKAISKKDVRLVGGKNGSLGEMLSQLSRKGVNVPDGFALTTKAYRYFIKRNKLDKKLKDIFADFNSQDIKSLQATGKAARELILRAEFPLDLKKEILRAYKKLSAKYGQEESDVAVRSSGVAEDAPTMSFAGQFESFLNVSGADGLLTAIKECLASAFGDRVIVYREEKKVPHLKFALSVGVQKMVRSDLASSGVIFTVDTETGFQNVVLISSLFGIGEMIVKGKVTPDEFYVFKPTLKQGYKSIIIKNLGRKTKKYIYGKTGGLKEVGVPRISQGKFSLKDEEVLTLAKWALLIEEHYRHPQDIEWAKDGRTGELFIVQSRPETVHSPQKGNVYQEYQIKAAKKPILTGIAVGSKIGQGPVRVISDVSKISQFKKGEVLVTKMTDPDWVSVFPLAAAVVTDEGGKTSHAAIVSRELGLPCIVGVKVATKVLKQGQEVTVDCSQGAEGRVLSGKVPFKVREYDLKKLPKVKTKIMVNIGAPEAAFKTSFLPTDGVGLARQEFVIAEKIRVHPLALYHYKNIQNKKIKKQIDEITVEHKDKKEYFVKELAEGVAQIAAAFWPKPVILRFSDLKSNEYRSLVGGELFEPQEENPMLGWRGASRYYDAKFRPAFKMECEAIKRVRDEFGLKNIKLMVPFCRTVEEGQLVLKLMREYGLERGKDGLEVYVMAEIPSNVLLADKFLDIFDGMSIGSNDLTQLVLGLDRDSALIAKVGDERNEAVKEMIAKVIQTCKKRKKYSGICGQAPSDYPDFAEFLVKEGIGSISLNPDTVIKTILALAGAKRAV